MEKILKTFATNLRTLRKEQNITQEELADKLGISLSRIVLLERGERIPALPTLDKIAKYFGVKPADLIMEEKKHQKLDQKQKELLNIVEKGSEEELDKLYEVVKIVVGDPK